MRTFFILHLFLVNDKDTFGEWVQDLFDFFHGKFVIEFGHKTTLVLVNDHEPEKHENHYRYWDRINKPRLNFNGEIGVSPINIPNKEYDYAEEWFPNVRAPKECNLDYWAGSETCQSDSSIVIKHIRVERQLDTSIYQQIVGQDVEDFAVSEQAENEWNRQNAWQC